MDRVPKDVLYKVAMTLNPDNLLRLCQVDTRFNRICNDDRFWERYYEKWVPDNPRYIIDPTFAERGEWKQHFFLNYHEIHTYHIPSRPLYHDFLYMDIKPADMDFLYYYHKKYDSLIPARIVGSKYLSLILRDDGTAWLRDKGEKELVTSFDFVIWPFMDRLKIDNMKILQADQMHDLVRTRVRKIRNPMLTQDIPEGYIEDIELRRTYVKHRLML